MIFTLEKIYKSFGEKEVLKGASFEFEDGKIYGLLGKNGAGKTTLFRILDGDLTADSGSFTIDGVKPDYDSTGFVPSIPEVPDFLTAREYIRFFTEINETPDMDTDILLELAGISQEDRDRLLKDFSHGMKNKVLFLVQLILDPEILLLDEPLTSLDLVAAEEMKEYLKKFKEGRITIISTHMLNLALTLCDRIVLLSDGKLTEIDLENMGYAERREEITERIREGHNV